MEEKKLGQSKAVNHNVILEGRKKMSVSGVEDVGNFDESSVTLTTSLGVLTVMGSGLHINKLSVETGDVEIEGTITSLCYGTEKDKDSGFLKRLFR